VTTPLQALDVRINTALQGYLGTPAEERNKQQYEGLCDDLARAAMDYAKQLIEARLQQLRQQKRSGW